MPLKDDDEIKFLIMALAEVTQANLSELGVKVLLEDLKAYPADAVKIALARCRKECRRWPSFAEIAEKLPDGRPSGAAAFAMLPKSEADTVVWTEEMKAAWRAAGTKNQQLFIRVYDELVAQNRGNGVPAKWSVSRGTCAESEVKTILSAVNQKLLTVDQARVYLPDVENLLEPKMISAHNLSRVMQLVGDVVDESDFGV